MEKILRIIDSELSNVDSESLRYRLILENPNLTEEKRVKKLKLIKTEYDKLVLCHDVLNILYHHQDEVFRDVHVIKYKSWSNELEIPGNLLKNVVEDIEFILNHHEEKLVRFGYEMKNKPEIFGFLSEFKLYLSEAGV